MQGIHPSCHLRAAYRAATIPAQYWPGVPILNRPTLYENRTARAHIRSGTVLTRVSPKYFSLEVGFLNQKKFLMMFRISLGTLVALPVYFSKMNAEMQLFSGTRMTAMTDNTFFMKGLHKKMICPGEK